MTTETRHPLFAEVTNGGARTVHMFGSFPYDDGQPGHQRVELAVLRGVDMHGPAGEHDTYQLDVRHEWAVNDEGDAVCAARYVLTDVTLKAAWGNRLTFTGWLTTFHFYADGADPFSSPYLDFYPYMPPRVETTLLPVRVEFTVWEAQA